MDGTSTIASAGAENITVAGRIGHILSTVLHPLVVGTPVALWVGIRQFGGISREVLELIAWIAGLGLVFPLGLLYTLQRTGRISDFFLTRKEERRWLYPVGVADMLLIYWFFQLYGAPLPILATVAAGTLATICMGAANSLIKASLHTAGNSGIILALCWVEGWHLWPLWFLVALTIWARWAAREHTPAELAAGLALGTLPTAIVMETFLGGLFH